METDRNKVEALNMELRSITAKIMKYKDFYSNMKEETIEMKETKPILVEALDSIKVELDRVSLLLNDISNKVIEKQIELKKLNSECLEVHKQMQELHNINKTEERTIGVKRAMLNKDIEQQLKKIDETNQREKDANKLYEEAIAIKKEYERKSLELADMVAKFKSDKSNLESIREATLTGQRALNKDKAQHEKNVEQYKIDRMTLNNDRHKVKNIQEIVKKLIKEKA